MTAGPNPADLTALQAGLSTPAGFRARVHTDRTSWSIAWAALIFGALAAIYKAFNALRKQPDGLAGDGFWAEFFSTTHPDGGRSLLLTLAFWSVVILLPLGLVALAYSALTANAAAASLYARYQQDGYVAAATPIGYRMRMNKYEKPKNVLLLSHPRIPAAEYAQVARTLTALVADPDFNRGEFNRDLVVGAADTKGMPAADVFKVAPQRLLLYVADHTPRAAYVVISKAGAGRRVYRIRETER